MDERHLTHFQLWVASWFLPWQVRRWASHYEACERCGDLLLKANPVGVLSLPKWAATFMPDLYPVASRIVYDVIVVEGWLNSPPTGCLYTSTRNFIRSVPIYAPDGTRADVDSFTA